MYTMIPEYTVELSLRGFPEANHTIPTQLLGEQQLGNQSTTVGASSPLPEHLVAACRVNHALVFHLTLSAASLKINRQ
jgi:hypothetical protein